MSIVLWLRNFLVSCTNRVLDKENWEKIETETTIGGLFWQMYIFAFTFAFTMIYSPFKGIYLICVKINSKKFT